MSELHRDFVDKTLENFARNGLKPDEAFLKKVNVSADEVFKLLQARSKYKLDRVIIAGSIGKTTAINALTTDVDCVVFVNDHEPPFGKILSEFEDILTLAEQPISNVKCTKHSVQFKWKDVDFDLLPAANFLNDDNGHAGLTEEQRIRQQQKLTLAKINASPSTEKASYGFSSSLVESQLQFMKNQNAFTHEFIRLCKYWNKTIIIEKYVSGRSTIIELIAVKSAMEEIQQNSSSGQISMLRTFRTFLEKVKNFDKLNIRAVDFVIADSGIKAYADKAYSTFKKLPILQEPANPFNNLAGGRGIDEVIDLFKSYANETIRRLGQYFTGTIFGYIPLDEIFRVQGKLSIPIIPHAQLPKCLVGTEIVVQQLSKSLIVRNENKKLSNGLIESMKKYMDIFVLTQITAMMNSNKSYLGEQNVKDIVEKGIDRLLGIPEREWISAANEEHEDYDMTFSFPFSVQGRNYVLKASFEFSSS